MNVNRNLNHYKFGKGKDKIMWKKETMNWRKKKSLNEKHNAYKKIKSIINKQSINAYERILLNAWIQ